MSRPGSRSRRGFTLIEVLIAFLVLVIVTYLLYTMLIQGSQSAVAGIWRKTTGARLQTAADRLRDALEQASYPSVLLPEQNVIDEADNHYIVLNGQGPESARDIEVLEGQEDETGGEGGNYKCVGPGRKGGSDSGPSDDRVLVLMAKNCSPARDRMEGMDPPRKDGKATCYYFWLQNRRRVNHGDMYEAVMDLMYGTMDEAYPPNAPANTGSATITVGGGPDAIPEKGTLLVSDVNSVRMRILDKAGKGSAGPISDKESPSVEVVIRCVETDRGIATLGKVVSVRPHTGVRFQ